MLPLKDSGLQYRHKRAIPDLLTIQALTRFCVVLERVDRSVNIKRRIGLGGSHIPKTYLVILVAAGGKYFRELAQQLGTLLVGQLLQGSRSALAREFEGLCKVKTV